MNDKPPSTNGAGNPSIFRRVLRALRGEPWSRNEILNFLSESRAEFDTEEHNMIEGVLEVSETQVRDVMIPRSHMVVLEPDQSLDELLGIIIESGHSRFPVIGEDRDEVLGILLAKDLLRYYQEQSAETFDIHNFIRPASVIPESKRLNALLKEFRTSRNHMAIVADEYGGVAGLLTIEDVLEEIVGDIDDEHDIEELEFIQSDGERDGEVSYTVLALTRIEDFNEYFDCELSDEEFDTIGGLVLHELGRLPRRGERLEYGGFRFRVSKADRRRIDSLQVQRIVDNAPVETQ
ncbi:MAG TPA: transporter associated domain-containing protein [Woeseiaceae bacterium]